MLPTFGYRANSESVLRSSSLGSCPVVHQVCRFWASGLRAVKLARSSNSCGEEFNFLAGNWNFYWLVCLILSATLWTDFNDYDIWCYLWGYGISMNIRWRRVWEKVLQTGRWHARNWDSLKLSTFELAIEWLGSESVLKSACLEPQDGARWNIALNPEFLRTCRCWPSGGSKGRLGTARWRRYLAFGGKYGFSWLNNIWVCRLKTRKRTLKACLGPWDHERLFHSIHFSEKCEFSILNCGFTRQDLNLGRNFLRRTNHVIVDDGVRAFESFWGSERSQWKWSWKAKYIR